MQFLPSEIKWFRLKRLKHTSIYQYISLEPMTKFKVSTTLWLRFSSQYKLMFKNISIFDKLNLNRNRKLTDFDVRNLHYISTHYLSSVHTTKFLWSKFHIHNRLVVSHKTILPMEANRGPVSVTKSVGTIKG